MKVKFDILNNEPQLGDVLVFTIPYYKILVYGICTSFSKSGIPIVNITDDFKRGNGIMKKGEHQIRGQFVIGNKFK